MTQQQMAVSLIEEIALTDFPQIKVEWTKDTLYLWLHGEAGMPIDKVNHLYIFRRYTTAQKAETFIEMVDAIRAYIPKEAKDDTQIS